MKKTLILGAALTLLLALTACGREVVTKTTDFLNQETTPTTLGQRFRRNAACRGALSRDARRSRRCAGRLRLYRSGRGRQQ